MIATTNQTHDSHLKSWVASANEPSSDFPIQNLPFGIFKRTKSGESKRVGVAIGDRILDVSACVRNGLFTGTAKAASEACCSPSLNLLMSLGRTHWSALRQALSEILREDSMQFTAHNDALRQSLVPMNEAEMFVPAHIGDYTDFYASIHHATNVGSMFRPDNPLLPNYKHIPIGYHGRASSIVVSGTPVIRPSGQAKADDEKDPAFGETKQLDYELEVGCYIGPGNQIGRTIGIERAEEHLFGICLVNDWSARDIQKWEYQPLGPFLAKNFSTTVSPWVVTMEALAPFRTPAYERDQGDPRPLPYLSSDEDKNCGGIDLSLEVFLATETMRKQNIAAVKLSSGKFTGMYWTFAQMLAHHASNGCNLRPGDLIASGTVSGKTKESRGCLLELTWRGTEPVQLPTGESRKFLENGDEVIMRGYCGTKGFARIGLGECRGKIDSH
ncbi:MAG TPA: fumarylacetoacetase [Bacteroidota bacterium]|jgi:fumarylacetoacetase|nr:fumarylacetoacetase [Bacteroidota bacterium]